MPRARHLVLTGLLILGLLLAGWPSPPAIPASHAAASLAPGESPGTHHAPLAKKKHKKKKARKQKRKARKQKQRKRHRKQQQRQKPAKLDTGVLPIANQVNPIRPDGSINVQDRYIVRLRPDAGSPRRSARTMARDVAGVTPTHVYNHVFEGFAAVIPPDKLDAVRSDPRVAEVIPDTLVFVTSQETPTGIRRISADKNPVADIDGVDDPVDVDVALIDTAGNDAHEDLTIHAWANCTTSHVNSDDNGHGIFVGGVIGARDNGVGVVGVAPGARLWTIRSLINAPDGSGYGLTSWVLCGIDLVTKYATPQADGLGDIEVANFSITSEVNDQTTCGPGTPSTYHRAYCELVAAGVTVVVAAGNSAADASGFVPATYDEVITVSALADSNGEGGAPGPSTIHGPDESLATFSNYGADIDIAAPGVAIRSTMPTGSCPICAPSGYGVASGTSFSSPHVAGAAALYLAQHPDATPAEVRAALLANREQVHLTNDPDGIDEGVLNVEHLND
jgi:subtilisin